MIKKKASMRNVQKDSPSGCYQYAGVNGVGFFLIEDRIDKVTNVADIANQ
ncbi:MAG: hypothetical protein NMNS01_14350 [Nitrosomonas sp.]|nr:MAG: hypothetical protein NMNS01_14350 [Nitrosomonas sp.]